MTESRLTKAFLRVATGAVLVFIYTPLVMIAIYAFNPTIAQTWPPSGFTTQWFGEAFSNPDVLAAFGSSIVAGLFATAVALLLGTLAALAVQRYSFFGKESVSLILLLPLALPGVVTGIALSATFQTLDIKFGLPTVIVGHATFCVVIAYNNVLARLRRTPRSAEEASADLGAASGTTFRRITLPAMRTALLAGALLAFALSFDEVIVTNFTAGPGTETIPLFIFRSIQRPNELPVVNVVAFVLVLLSVIPVYIAAADHRGRSRGDSLDEIRGRCGPMAYSGSVRPGVGQRADRPMGRPSGSRSSLWAPIVPGRNWRRSTGSPASRWRSTISGASAGLTAAYHTPSG